MGLVCGIGINDCAGWSWGGNIELRKRLCYRIYQLWKAMIERCYSERSQAHKPSYKGCTVCERWLKLSNFAKDIESLAGFEMWKDNPLKHIMLDKDTLIAGNREYRPEACCFITATDSQHEVSKRCKDKLYNAQTQAARVASVIKKVICTFPDGREEIFDSLTDAERKYGFNHTTIAAVCKGKRNKHHGCQFRYA